MQKFTLREAQRSNAKIKMALNAPSGAGKTYGALLLASGLTNWDKIAVIDTENNSADLYSHLGKYKVLPLTEHSPESYSKAIDVCVEAGMEVVIIDSITHEWNWCLELHSSMAGNSFTNWKKVTPIHDKFVRKILAAPVHIIATMRTKQDYVLTEKNGRMVPEKVGLKSEQRGGIDYEFTIVLDVDIKHYCNSSKDRTGLFMDKPPFIITKETGELILEWCNQGKSVEEVRKEIDKAQSVGELLAIWHCYPMLQNQIKDYFSIRKQQIESAETEVKEEKPKGKAKAEK